MEYIHIFHQNLIHNIVSHLTATVNFKRDISKRETNTLVIIFSFIVLCSLARDASMTKKPQLLCNPIYSAWLSNTI